jgi:hypothetical protein
MWAYYHFLGGLPHCRSTSILRACSLCQIEGRCVVVFVFVCDVILWVASTGPETTKIRSSHIVRVLPVRYEGAL